MPSDDVFKNERPENQQNIKQNRAAKSAARFLGVFAEKGFLKKMSPQISPFSVRTLTSARLFSTLYCFRIRTIDFSIWLGFNFISSAVAFIDFPSVR